MAQNEPGSAISLAEVAVLVYRQRRQLLIALLAPVVLAILMVIVAAPVYTAATDIIVKTGREYLPQSEGEGAMSAPTSTKQEDINSEIALLTSRGMMLDAINTIGIDNLFPGLARNPPWFGTVTDAAVQAFSARLHVDPIKLSNMISISYDAGDPATAVHVLDQFVQAYQARHAKVFSSGRAESYGDSIKSALADLDALEKRRTEIKLDNRIYDILQQRTALIGQRVEAEAKLQDTIANRATLQKRLAYLNETKPKIPAMLPPAQEMQHAAQALTDLQESESEMSTRFGPGNPDLVRVREQIKALREKMGSIRGDLSSVTVTPSPLAQQVDQEIIMDQAELAPLDDQAKREKELVDSLNDELHRLEQADLELRTIATRIDTVNDNLKNLQARYDQARTEEDMDRMKLVSVTQVSPAVAPDKPTQPKPVLYTTFGLLAGVLLAAAMIVIGIIRNNKVIVEQSVERLVGLPVLASIPLLPQSPRLIALPKAG
jgi:uncharacterized protein involved in exopolysaccharide biosynthesis